MFKNPFSIEGRIRRLEYGLSYIIYIVYLVLEIIVLGVFVEGTGGQNDTVAVYLLATPAIWFMIAQGAKRCHDRNNSGWWQLIPFYGFWMVFADGDIGPNDYGDNPKGLSYDYEPVYKTGEAVKSIDNVDDDGIIKP
ncbi:DUF805 domain-containing protein [Pedobacter psychroterrae]|uniref:DUF805 domain-containing protein n=1 Tax=Pedobacter psychroterrae TaxID=2530453 RepID=A0A4R0NEN1_9SPHI|nr:DUF805 domain-containing protein [Pedobacter psychroterrae]TCC98901.1 DUF805 domain-containing protein [Pedobacter psychroterrae]